MIPTLLIVLALALAGLGLLLADTSVTVAQAIALAGLWIAAAVFLSAGLVTLHRNQRRVPAPHQRSPQDDGTVNDDMTNQLHRAAGTRALSPREDAESSSPARRTRNRRQNRT